jgi:opacity protein-like surface antigen
MKDFTEKRGVEAMKRNLLLTCATLATLFVCSSGQAADMPVKARPLPPAPLPYSWTGFYIGGNFGGVWSNVDIFDSEGNTFTTSGASGGMECQSHQPVRTERSRVTVESDRFAPLRSVRRSAARQCRQQDARIDDGEGAWRFHSQVTWNVKKARTSEDILDARGP